MGVLGLWKLIDGSGKPVPLESLENKVLAIDISIWLHQVVKGFQDAKGNALPNAHLLGLFNRLCKLLFYRIKPVFVFDGGVPSLKIDTINKRKDSKNKLKTEADRIQTLLLNSLAKEKIVQQALGSSTNILISPQKKPSPQKKNNSFDEIFKLPELPASQHDENDESTNTSNESQSENSFEDQNEANYYRNLKSIDINSAHFKSLPSDIRFEILTEMKETRKHASWGMIQDLPTRNNEFSNFQMNRLLKRRRIQQSLEEAETEIGGKCLSMDILESFVSDDVPTDPKQTEGGQFASDENRRFILIRELNKKIEKSKKVEEIEKKKVEETITSGATLSDDDDNDEELQKAIQMSLTVKDDENVTKPEIVDRAVDDNVDLNDLKFTEEQKKHLGSAASVLAKGFLMEYGGISADDFKDLMQRQTITPKKPKSTFGLLNVESVEEKNLNDDGVSSNTDSDLVEVASDDFNSSDMKFFPVYNKVVDLADTEDMSRDFRIEDLKRVPVAETSKPVAGTSKRLEIKIDINSVKTIDKIEDDLFHDVFQLKQDKDKKTISEKIEVIDLEEEPQKENSTISKVTYPNSKVVEQPKVLDILEDLKKQKMAIASIDLNNILSVDKATKSTDFNIRDLLESSKSETNIILDTDDDDAGFESDATIIDHEWKTLDLKKVQEEATQNELPTKDIKQSVTVVISDDDNDAMEVGFKTPTKSKPNQPTTPSSKESLKLAPVFTTPKTAPSTPKTASSTPKTAPIKSTTPKTSAKENSINISQSPVQLTIPPELEESLSKTHDDKSLNPKNLMAEFQAAAAENLKTMHSKQELEDFASLLNQEKFDLERERNRQDRMGTNITQQMSEECKELLKLFGVPYIVAPMEAEAQCAFLNLIKLTDGTITDDSDIWLFGGQTVYKNFFNLKKNVMEFRMENIEKLYKIDRQKMIQLALLVGSDYTTGINGIGAITALEILASFPPQPEKEGETSDIMSILSSLRRFREWYRSKGSICTNLDKAILRGKLKNIEITQGFPYLNVVEAYLYPKVDDNSEQITWGQPNDDAIRDYTRKKFGWTRLKTDETLLPVLNRLNERKQQKSITNYFNLQCTPTDKNLKVSKRMRTAINKLSDNTGDNTELLEVSPKKPKRGKAKPKIKKTENNDDIILITSQNDDQIPTTSSSDCIQSSSENVTKISRGRPSKKQAATCLNSGDSEEPLNPTAKTRKPRTLKSKHAEPSTSPVDQSTSNANDKDDDFRTKTTNRKRKSNEIFNGKSRTPRIPNTKLPIPQREKELEEIEKNRIKAAEIFKKSKK